MCMSWNKGSNYKSDVVLDCNIQPLSSQNKGMASLKMNGAIQQEANFVYRQVPASVHVVVFHIYTETDMELQQLQVQAVQDAPLALLEPEAESSTIL